MKEFKTFSISELLYSQAFKGHQTKLAEYLKINRGVLGKMKEDIHCNNHIIISRNGCYEYFSKSMRMLPKCK